MGNGRGEKLFLYVTTCCEHGSLLLWPKLHLSRAIGSNVTEGYQSCYPNLEADNNLKPTMSGNLLGLVVTFIVWG